ncbi:pirin family protein [Variovorax sp. J22P271]|uniref:pirin family protein n=1 Tax=Variovorax davisae TaxID=3053515 RepID=UPI002575935D|nr:pirin family protein [Variovorax sp. J22P271]MDM0032337.1 pirin family protein [Variovorax sp. J22P271]
MNDTFVLRDSERGYDHFLSTGEASSYIGGHPEATLSRHSSFNFGPYQSGRAGFGRVRVFGDEVFRGAGCGYNIHPHHNFIICAFVLQGTLTHINTVGKIDQLKQGDYYAFSAGAGGKHCERNLENEDVNVIYLWILPDQLLLPPSYARHHFDAASQRNQIVPLVGRADGALRISQDLRVSRLASDQVQTIDYLPASPEHGVYVFVLEGEASCNGTRLGRRDSTGIWGEARITIETGAQDADLLIVESVR